MGIIINTYMISSSTKLKLGVISAVWSFYFIFQQLIRLHSTKNLIRNKDNVSNSNLMWAMHDWFKEHSTISNIFFKTPNHLAINGFYFYAMGRFIFDGARTEAATANFFFH